MFRIYPEKETAVLAIPEACTDKIITLYHKSLFAGHQGVIKTYLTISDKFFIPNLIHYLRSYVKVCHICQLSRNKKPPTRHFQTRINPNYIPISRLSMDFKVMPKLQKGHRYILCVIDEVTNFLIRVPIFQERSEEVGEALLEHVVTKDCIPDYIIDLFVHAIYGSHQKNLSPIILPNFIQIIHIYTWIYTFIHLLYTLDFREY